MLSGGRRGVVPGRRFRHDGLALNGVAFSLTCAVAATLFAVLTALQIRSLPPQSGSADTERTPLIST